MSDLGFIKLVRTTLEAWTDDFVRTIETDRKARQVLLTSWEQAVSDRMSDSSLTLEDRINEDMVQDLMVQICFAVWNTATYEGINDSTVRRGDDRATCRLLAARGVARSDAEGCTNRDRC